MNWEQIEKILTKNKCELEPVNSTDRAMYKRVLYNGNEIGKVNSGSFTYKSNGIDTVVQNESVDQCTFTVLLKDLLEQLHD